MKEHQALLKIRMLSRFLLFFSHFEEAEKKLQLEALEKKSVADKETQPLLSEESLKSRMFHGPALLFIGTIICLCRGGRFAERFTSLVLWPP